jgi:hypothetical protein
VNCTHATSPIESVRRADGWFRGARQRCTGGRIALSRDYSWLLPGMEVCLRTLCESAASRRSDRPTTAGLWIAEGSRSTRAPRDIEKNRKRFYVIRCMPRGRVAERARGMIPQIGHWLLSLRQMWRQIVRHSSPDGCPDQSARTRAERGSRCREYPARADRGCPMAVAAVERKLQIISEAGSPRIARQRQALTRRRSILRGPCASPAGSNGERPRCLHVGIFIPVELAPLSEIASNGGFTNPCSSVSSHTSTSTAVRCKFSLTAKRHTGVMSHPRLRIFTVPRTQAEPYSRVPETRHPEAIRAIAAFSDGPTTAYDHFSRCYIDN